jgi:LPXTG-motif cell wall-anchored protein
MLGFLLLLLVIWVVVSIVGAVIEGLLWLTVVGIVLFLATAAWGWSRRRTSA